MTSLRNKSIRDQVLYRDFHLCRCCGFKANEAHHIIPIIYKGEDKPENMVALCHFCHKHSPDTESEFIEYIKKGGAFTAYLLGKAVKELEYKKLDFQIYFPLAKEMIKWLRECDINNAIENHNLLTAQSIPEADIIKIMFKDKQINTDGLISIKEYEK